MPETSEVIVVAEVRAKSGQADALRAVLLAAVAPSRKEAGNNTYRLHEDKQTPGHFVFYENWKSQEAIDEHMRTPHFKTLVAQAESLAEPLSIKLLRALTD
jgi:quinol monooxygenase YgiN